MNRRGVSIYETVALICLIAAAWFGDVVGSRYSNVLGIIGMVVFPVLLIILIEKLAWLERELFIGQKPFPLCRCGKTAIDQMTEENLDGQLLRKCSCGLRYNTAGRGRITILDDGGENDFAVWRPFKGWQTK